MATSLEKTSSYSKHIDCGCLVERLLPPSTKPVDRIRDMSYSVLESDTKGATATRACRQTDMTQPASKSDSGFRLLGSALAVRDLAA